MIERKKTYMYTSKRKMVHGRGFIDTLKGIGSYIYENRDLLAKPMLSAVGNVGALALTEGSKALINKLKEKQLQKESPTHLTKESQQILNSLMNPTPVGNIIGSGIKTF